MVRFPLPVRQARTMITRRFTSSEPYGIASMRPSSRRGLSAQAASWAWTCFAAVVAIPFFLAPSAFAADKPTEDNPGVEIVKGYAFDMKEDTLLYTEEHKDSYENDVKTKSTVTYRDAEGEVIVEKDLTYNVSQTIPTFTKRDLRNNYLVGAKVKGNKVEMFVGGSGPKDKIKRKTVRSEKEMVVDAGFNAFIQENWDDLCDDKTLKIEFATPSILKVVTFKINRIGEEEVAGQKVHRFRMKTNALLYRLFLDPIDVSYCQETRRLVAYEGLSNIKDAEGEQYKTRIVFPREGEDPKQYLTAR